MKVKEQEQEQEQKQNGEARYMTKTLGVVRESVDGRSNIARLLLFLVH